MQEKQNITFTLLLCKTGKLHECMTVYKERFPSYTLTKWTSSEWQSRDRDSDSAAHTEYKL